MAKNRQASIMAGIALVSVLGSYLLYYFASSGGVWGTTNHGELLAPGPRVQDMGWRFEDGQAFLPDGQWWLVTIAPAGCGQPCQASLGELRQLHVRLNKDASRVQRAVLADPAAALSGAFPNLVPLTVAPDAPVAVLDEGVYIVDPLGNVVLRYRLPTTAGPVFEDLKKLLKVSQIG